MRYILPAVLLLAGCTRSVPGQGSLQSADVAALAKAFDAAPGTKMVAIYSPRCSVCAASASALQRALDGDADKSVRVWVVWIPVERFDSIRGVSAEALGHVRDARAVQLWDQSLAVPAALCGFDPPSPACKDSPAALWGWVGLWPANARWGSRAAWAAFDPGDAQFSAAGLEKPL
jgi:hypothetical protein